MESIFNGYGCLIFSYPFFYGIKKNEVAIKN
jgi:hypothetical protein